VSRRRKVIILLSWCLSLLIVSMDATIVNVAIPSIRTELHGSASQAPSSWRHRRTCAAG
jgi:hypothetical protein